MKNIPKGCFIVIIAILLNLSLAIGSLDLVLSNNKLSKTINSTLLTITNNENISYNFSITTPINITDNRGKIITINRFPSETRFLIQNGTWKTINLSYSSLPSDFGLGSFSTAIIVKADENNNITSSIPLQFINTYCKNGYRKEATDNRNLEIISVKDTSSDNDWEWKPLDSVDIDVKIRFNSDDSSDDIDAVIKLGLYDKDDNIFIDFENDDDTEREVSLDEGDSVTEKFTLEIPIEDIEDGSGRYKLYFKIYEDGNENGICSDRIGGEESTEIFKDITIEKESREVILKNIKFESPVACEDDIKLTAKVFNIGSNDEKKVYVSLFNKELGINLESSSFELDEGDAQDVSFNFKIPENAAEKTYTLSLYTHFNYKKSSEIYDDTSDVFEEKIRVEGNCVKPLVKPSITAVLITPEEQVKAGKEVTIKATIANAGTERTTYLISLEGNVDFSSLKGIEPSAVSIDGGKSQDVLITLSLNKDADGEKNFNIILKTADGKEVAKQPLSLSISKPGFSITGLAITENFKENWVVWLIVLINLILIIAIIIVVIKMSRA